MARPKTPHPTPGELEVHRVLWRDGACTVREVMDQLNLNRKRPRVYTSVMSLLNVMADKDLLRREPQGRAFVYRPRVKESPTLRRIAADLLERVFDGSASQLVAHALDQTSVDTAELDAITDMIEAHRRKKENS